LTIEEKYPLPEREKNLLIDQLMGSGAIFILIGIVLSIIYTGVRTGDWLWTIVYFGWAYEFGQAMTFGQSPLICVVAAVAVPAFFLLLGEVIDRIFFKRSEKYRSDVLESRQGFTGELPRLEVGYLFLTSAVAGFSEEFAFRYGGIGVLSLLLANFMSPIWATGFAIAITAIVFADAHGNYPHRWQKAFVVASACVFGMVFALTGSLLAIALCHGLYDLGTCFIERSKMMRDSKYFPEGKAPIDAIEAEMKELREMLDEMTGRRK
jgi:membrane protease YdiL (CAAX protease family)